MVQAPGNFKEFFDACVLEEGLSQAVPYAAVEVE